MAAEAVIPAPICETIRDQVGNIIIEQATTSLINKIPQEEKNQTDAPSEPPSVEGDSFLKPPSVDEVHCDVNNNTIDASEATEKKDEAVKNEPQKDNQTVVDAADEETSSKGIQQNCEETKVTEKTEVSSLIQVGSSHTESDEQLETENEKLHLTEVSTASAVIMDKIKDEDEDLRKTEFVEKEKAEKEGEQIDKPVDSLHVVTEEQDSKPSCPDEKTIDSNQKVIEDEKIIEAVDTENPVIESFSTVVSSYQGEGSANANLEGVTQKEVLEDISAIISNEEIDEKPKIKVDASEMETAEHLEKESEKPSPLPLAEESNLDESMDTHEAQEERDLMKAELCENAEIREDASLKIDSKMDKPDDPLHKASEETSSLLLDRKTEDKTFNEAEIKDESSENVASVVSNEKAGDESLIPVDCPEMKNGGHFDEVKTEDEHPRGTESFEEEINEITVSLKEEVQIEKPAEPCHAAVEEIKASENSHGNLGDKLEEKTIDAAENNEKDDELQDTNEPASSEITKTSISPEEQNLTDSQAIISNNRVDAIDTKEMTHEVQNGTTTTPHEYIQEDSITQSDCTQMGHLERESENQTSIEVQPEKNNGEPECMHELKDRQVDLIKAELLENEENTGSGSVKEHAEMEKRTEFLPAVTADMKAIDSSPYTEISEEQIQTSYPQEISSDIIEEKTIGTASTKEETLENIVRNPPGVLGEKTEKTIASAESNEKTDELQVTPEDNKESASNEDIQITCSPEEQSLMTDSQAIMNTKTIDVIDTKEVTDEVQNVERIMLHEHTEGNSEAQADCTHLEKVSEISSLEEAQSEENNGKEPENMIEFKNRNADPKKDEFLENEKNTGIDSVKEEAQIEKPIDSLKVVTEDIIVCDSAQYTEIIEEQIQTVDPQEISSEKIEERTIDAADTNESLEDIAKNAPIVDHNQTVEVDGAEKPCLEKASTSRAKDDDSTVTHKGELVDESSKKADLSENEKITEEILVKEQASTESLQIATEDITEFASVQARETSPLVEQNPTANPQENEGDQREDKANDETGVKEEILEDKDVTTTVPFEATKERSVDQDDCSEMKQNEQLEKESENSTLIETPKEEIEESTLVMEEACKEKLVGSPEATNSVEELITSRDTEEISGENTEEKPIDAAKTNKASHENVETTIPDEDTGNNSLIKEDFSQSDQNKHLGKECDNPSLTEPSSGETTEFTLVEEETGIEKLTDQLQVENKDIKASSLGSEPEICSVEEKVQTADPQENSSDKREEKLVDAGYTEAETIDLQIPPNVSNEDNEDNLSIKVDCTEKKSLEKASKERNDDVSTATFEAKSVDQISISPELKENEKNAEGTLKEEVPIEPSQEVAVDIKTVISVQDSEKSSPEKQNPTANPQEIKHGHEETKRSDTTSMTQETPEEKDVAPTMPQEEVKENLQIQKGSSKLESDKDLEKENENPTSTETPTGYMTLVAEEAQVEKLTNPSKIATEDIKESASGQDTETISTEEQILTTDPREISGEQSEEKAADSADTKEPTLENVETTIPHEGIEVDCSQIKENEHLEKESENPYSIKGSSGDTTESSLVKDETQMGKLNGQLPVATDDIKPCPSAEPETSSSKEQIRIVDPQEISSDDTEKTPNDAVHSKDETANAQNVEKTIPHEGIEVDCSQIKENEHLEKESENPSLIEVSSEGTTESSLVKDEAQVGKLNNQLTVATDDIKPCPSAEPETSSNEGQIQIVDQEISSDNIEKTPNDAAHSKEETVNAQNVETTIPHEATEVDCSQIEENKHLEKESENPSSTKGSSGDTTKSSLVKDEAQFRKLNDQLPVATDDITPCPNAEPETSSTKEQIRILDPQEISSDNTEKTPNDAAHSKDETVIAQNVETAIPHEGTEVDCSQIKENKHLEKESEGSSGDTTESNLVKDEAQVRELNDQLPVATDDIKPCPSAEPETSPSEEQIQIVDPQEFSCDKTEKTPNDAAHSKDEPVNAQQNIATSVSNEEREDNLTAKVNGTENSCLGSTGSVGDDASKIRHDATCVDERSTEADSFGSENNTEGTSIKDEVHIEPLSEVAGDIKTLASDQDRETSSPNEGSLTADPQELVEEHNEIKASEPDDKNTARTMPQEDVKENTPIQVDRSQMECEERLEQESEDPCSTETLTGDTKDYSLQEVAKDFNTSTLLTEITCMEEQVLTTYPQETSGEKMEEVTIDAAVSNKEALDIKQGVAAKVSNKEDEDNSPIEPNESTNDDLSIIINDGKSVDDSSTEAGSYQNERNTRGTTLLAEVPIEPSQEVGEDIKTIVPIQGGQTSSSVQQSPNVDTQEVVDDHKENKIIDAANLKEETTEDKNYTTITPQADTNEDSQIQVHCLQTESGKYLEKKNEDHSLTETSTATNIESTLVTEEAQMEKHIDCLQATTEDAEASDSVQVKETSSTEEQVCTTESGESSLEITEERIADEILGVQDIVTNAPTGDDEDTKPTRADDRENPSLEKASTGKNNDDVSTITHEVIFADESSITTNLCEDEKDTKAVFMKEEASCEPLQVAAEHIEEIKVSASSQDSEISYTDKLIISEDAQEISGNKPEEKATNAVEAVETLVFQDITRDGPKDDEDNLPIKEVGSQKPYLHAEKMEVLENDVQVCLASAHGSNITQEMQNPEEAYLPSLDEKITEKTTEEDNSEKEAMVDVGATKSKYIEQLEQENTAKCFMVDEKSAEIEQDGTECRQEKEMLDEKVHEIIETTSTSVDNGILPESPNETAEKDDFTTERALTMDKEELHTRAITPGEDQEPIIDEDKIKEAEASEATISNFSPATPDMIETTEQDITRLPSESPKEICTGQITGEANTSYVTTDTRESTSINKDISLEDIHINSRSGGNLQTTIDSEAPEIKEIISCNMEGQEILSTSVGETSALISLSETDEFKHGSTRSVTAEKTGSDEVEFAHGEKQNEVDSKNQELESTVNIESCDIISKVEEMKTSEASLKVADGKVEVQDRFQPNETAHETEPAGVYISREKIKEDEDENVDGYHIVSCMEEVTTKSHPDDEVKQEEGMQKEEVFEVLQNANETDLVSKDFEEANDKIVVPDKEKSLVHESIDGSLHQEKGEKTIEEFTTALDTEDAQGKDHAYTNAAEDSREKDYEVQTSFKTEDQTIKHHASPQESHVMDSQVKMAQKDGPMYPDSIRDINDDMQKSKEGYVEESNKENLVDCPNESVSSDCGHVERTSQVKLNLMEELESKDKPSLSDLLHVHVKETSEMSHHSVIEKESTTCREELHSEKTDEVEHEEAKTDKEKNDEEQSNEDRKSDLCSEAPVMVESGETDLKGAHKKSHNLLSGVGSKVKHSIAKVKKAITGKSSQPKPPSPK